MKWLTHAFCKEGFLKTSNNALGLCPEIPLLTNTDARWWSSGREADYSLTFLFNKTILISYNLTLRLGLREEMSHAQLVFGSCVE